MAINPLAGGYMPQALEHQQETHHQDNQTQTNKTELKQQTESPINNPDMAQVVQQQGEAIPIQQSHESSDVNYTDREGQGNQSEEEDQNAVEAMEEKTKKSVEDLQKGLEQVAEGIEQLKELSRTDSGIPKGLDQQLEKIARMGQKLVVEIENTVEKTVINMLTIGENFFTLAVADLTAVRTTIEDFIGDMSKRQMRIPTPEIRDESARAQALRKEKQNFTRLLNAISDSTNLMLESAEGGLHELLSGHSEIRAGFHEINRGEAGGFKKIEAGFRAFFNSVNTITDSVNLFRGENEYIFRELTLLPPQLEKAIGGRAALGLPERLAALLWDSPERVDQCWRTVQGHLGTLSGALLKFGNEMEANFEEASRAVVIEGQEAVDCVNTDLADIKDDVKQTLTPSAAEAVEQIIDGADQVENALDDLIETSESKHETIKRGSVNKRLPSHFNVRL